MNQHRIVAALYVLRDGPYAGLPDVEVWDEARDARLYAGPHPVVAHPPCARWDRFWYGGPTAVAKGQRRIKGDDGGCFAAALAAVREWGGVLEHPEGSHAWPAFGLFKPPQSGGWVPAGDFLGWTCCVEQGHYGHPARKATWLYAVTLPLSVPACDRWNAPTLPELIWGPSHLGERHRSGAAWVRCGCCGDFWCTIHRRHAYECACPPAEEWKIDPYTEGGGRAGIVEVQSHRQRALTPEPFRDMLLAMAREVGCSGH